MNHRRFPSLSAFTSPDSISRASDAELLASWVAHRDETAFELLVRRHGPAVLAACRRLLADANDADDAFQAAFLVLARKAGAVACGEALAAWLHRVAYRVALRIRADRARRTDRQESGMVDQLPAPSAADPAWTELLRVLDEEVELLPKRHRTVFVLCCLEGKTGEEAAKLLGCPPGTISSRLTRARERLRHRLMRRGFAPSALPLAALGGDTLALPVPNSLVEAVLRTAPSFSIASSPAGPPSRPAGIAEGVVRAMFAQKLKLIPALLAASLLVVGVVLAGSSGKRDNRPTLPEQRLVNPAADEKTAVPVVAVIRPQRGGLERTTTQTCVVKAGLQTDLMPAATGILKQVQVRLGEHVKAGDLLAEIDSPTLPLDEKLAAIGVDQAAGLVKVAEARIATAKAEVRAAEGVIALRQAELKAANAGADYRQKQFLRLKTLAEQKAVDAKLVDEAEDHLLQAKGLVDAAKVGVENAKTDVQTKMANLTQMQAGLLTAKTNFEIARIGLQKAQLALAQTRIKAPFDGVVAASDVATGDFVRPGDRARPLFTIMRADFLRLVVHVPEWYAIHLKPGTPAEVAFDALPEVKLDAKVARVGVAVESVDRTLQAEIDLANPKGLILPGMTGRVTLNLGKGPADAVRVPAGAVIRTAGRTAVYVYQNGMARLRRVEVSYSNPQEAEVTSGLTSEDLVVTEPTKLMPKTEAKVKIESSKKNSSSPP